MPDSDIPPATPTGSLSFFSVNMGRPSDMVYVRWVTMKLALNHQRLSDIEIDPVPLRPTSKLSYLKQRACRWLGNRVSDKSPVELYLENCFLFTSSNKNVGLEEMGLTGSREEPLSIFVVQVDSITSLGEEEKEILEKIAVDTDQDISSALLQAAHFPPAVLALGELQYHGLEKQELGLEKTVLINCLRDIATKAKMTVRSVTSWLLGQNQPTVLRCAQRSYMNPGGSPGNADVYKDTEEVSLPSSTDAFPNCAIVRVGVPPNVNINKRMLAFAFHGNYGNEPKHLDHFLDDSDEIQALLYGEISMPERCDSDSQVCLENSRTYVGSVSERARPRDQPDV